MKTTTNYTFTALNDPVAIATSNKIGFANEHPRQDTEGIRLDIAAPACRSNTRA
jgi:hypothetical protein